jgi:ferrochelatase
MKADGVSRAITFVTSAFSSYSGCRQYLEDLEMARSKVGPDAPVLHKLRGFFNHPGFIECMASRVESAFEQLDPREREHAALVFTAHSVPISMASGSPYVGQLQEACRLVAEACGRSQWMLAYQSRSGPPTQPWLEPDVLEVLRTQAGNGVENIVVVPIGFVSDHMEVLYDLDTEAQQLAAELGVRLIRARTAGTHPRFIRMIRELIEERLSGLLPQTMGLLAPAPDVCPADCCPAPRRPLTVKRTE